jgi:hypothetical protein
MKLQLHTKIAFSGNLKNKTLQQELLEGLSSKEGRITILRLNVL